MGSRMCRYRSIVVAAGLMQTNWRRGWPWGTIPKREAMFVEDDVP
jgi:hypothetical protein